MHLNFVLQDGFGQDVDDTKYCNPATHDRSGQGLRLFERFSKYFCHPFEAIQHDGQGWRTLKHPLSPEQIFQAWQDEATLIGLRFGKFTRYGLLDIDAGSPYCNDEGLKDIRWALEQVGINDTILIRSSRSQGWHLYFGFSRPVHTFGLSCLLHQTLEAAGLEITGGKLEVFPNRKGWQPGAFTRYNGHRLPLQSGTGAYLLDDDFQPYSQSIETFLNLLDQSAEANDIELIEDLAAEARSHYNPSKRKAQVTGRAFFQPHNPNAKKWKASLEEAIAEGWTAHHQSNILLGQIAEYGRVFLGFEDEERLGDYVANTAVACPGFIPYCRHAKEIKSWSLRWARSAIKLRYPYGTKRGGQFKQLGKGGLTNEERKADAMTRIADAVTDFEASGRAWPSTIHARRKLVAGMAQSSERTLQKSEYLPLWHPKFRETAANAPKPYTVSNSATQYIAGSHPNNNCVILIPASISAQGKKENNPLRFVRNSKNQQAPIFVESHHNQQDQSPPKIPELGAWLVERACPHVLLRLQSVDADGDWCRCQNSHQRRHGLKGGLYLLDELTPSPLAIAEIDPKPPEEMP